MLPGFGLQDGRKTIALGQFDFNTTSGETNKLTVWYGVLGGKTTGYFQINDEDVAALDLSFAGALSQGDVMVVSGLFPSDDFSGGITYFTNFTVYEKPQCPFRSTGRSALLAGKDVARAGRPDERPDSSVGPKLLQLSGHVLLELPDAITEQVAIAVRGCVQVTEDKPNADPESRLDGTRLENIETGIRQRVLKSNGCLDQPAERPRARPSLVPQPLPDHPDDSLFPVRVSAPDAAHAQNRKGPLPTRAANYWRRGFSGCPSNGARYRM